MGESRRRFALVLVAVAAFAAAFLYPSNPATQGAQAYARSVATASGGVYVTLRSLNAVLSTAQEIEVGGSFVVQGTAQPLKVLEPIDDTVERIAGVVFSVMVATGLISVAMGPASAVGFAMVGVAALLRLGAGMTGGAGGSLVRPLGVYGLFLAAALPLSFLVAALLADRMTAGVWAEHSAVLAEITASVAPEIDTAGSGGWRAVMEDAERYGTLASNLYGRADDLVASLVAILAVFLFKVLVLPLLILGGFLVLSRSLALPPGRFTPMR
ncbi:hypothetical protein [Thetidibacter halocola]|uniref:Uncharacterized protein n=1 Tax=Thetidibacter halocola TaxID=2827239 RepID=A0A8J7WCX5_9RHOB|nr:hypothetical protein [Thetidibacter halocola]MBS0125275.1 hypothetical protein [Thetidibacter halocola]